MTTNLLTVSLSSETSLANLLKGSLITDAMNANLLNVGDGCFQIWCEFAENRPAIDGLLSEDAWIDVDVASGFSEMVEKHATINMRLQ